MLNLIKEYVIHVVIHHLGIDMGKQRIGITKWCISSIFKVYLNDMITSNSLFFQVVIE